MTKTNTAQILKPSLETVAAIAERYAEPEWMLEKRRAAWKLYQEMPLPHAKEEAWRRTSLKLYPLDNLKTIFSSREIGALDDLPPCWNQTMTPETQVSGTLVHCDNSRVYATMRKDDVARGVVLEDLHKALHTHGELIRRYWMQGSTSRPDFNKFTALNGALWHGGTFVYAPTGVRVARPLQSLVTYNGNGGTGLHHTLIIAEKGSHVTLIQDRVSQDHGPELNAEVVEIYAEEGASVRYISLQHWSEKRYSVSVQNAELARDTNLVWVNGALGGHMSKEFLYSSLNAPGARSLMQGFSFARGEQHFDQSTYQHHRAANTYSDLLYRNVLRDQARTVFYGMVRVETEAQGTQGYQANNNLLLDTAGATRKPHAHSIPGLEIIANDVRCSHGSTTSRIDPQQLFYLQARGLPRFDAESLVVQGFLRPIIERVPLAKMREHLSEEITRRFWDQT